MSGTLPPAQPGARWSTREEKDREKTEKSIISTIADGLDIFITARLIKNTLPDIKSGVWVGLLRTW